MRINEDYYPNLIKEFYESLEEVEKNEVFRVKIRDQMHDISVDKLASAFRIKVEGNMIGSFKEVNRLRGYDETTFIDSLIPNSNLSKERTNTPSLPQ